MNNLQIALATELRKAAASRVFRSVTVLLIAGISVLAGALIFAARIGREEILAKLGPLADATGWPLLANIVMQVTSAGGLAAFGIAVSWIFGREFLDGTITSLFALPVRRSTIASAKLSIYLGWAILTAAALTLTFGMLGLILGYGPDAAAAGLLGQLFVLTVFTALLAVPAAWATTLGRGLLPGIATTIGIVVIAQVGVVAGIGGWMPLAAPAIWAMRLEPVSPVQLLLSLIIPAVCWLATTRAWSRLELDR
ncbi:ABC transporter permease [Agromyces sp. Marseille-Q5079]|uniref:ABC transporter permease n=1 Tax=Agromyces sp. Marseille-Q5079 TaxID=3439059 RepID=UPI003D9CAC9D